MKEININTIIKQVLAGKPKKYEKIIEYYKNRLFGYIVKQVKNTQDSEDILQEVFLKTYRNLHLYNPEQSFTTWIVTITRNCIMDHFRKHKITLELCDDRDIIDHKTPESIYLKQETTSALDEKIHELPEKYKILILMKYFEDLSYDEISIKLDIPTKKVKWQLHQARQLLTKTYEEEVTLWNAK